MKALSIRQPSIAALLTGRKSIEVRAYATRHRGDLLLHAAASFSWREREELKHLRQSGVDLPDPDPAQRGALVGLAQLIGCRRMTDADWDAALVEPREGTWWAWELDAVEAFPRPIPYRGRLFMWAVPDTEFEAALAAVS
jgi:hypothetical protein